MHLGCVTTLAIGSNVSEGAACGTSATLPATTSRPAIMGERIRIVSSSSRAQLILERKLPDAPAGRGENRIRHRGSGDGRAWFADSAWRFQVAHQVHLDGRRLVDSHDSNVMEVGLLDPAVLERHAAPQGAADSEDYPALDLGLHRVRVHDRPAIDCADDPVDADLARPRHRDLGHLRQITAPFAEKHRHAAPRPSGSGFPHPDACVAMSRTAVARGDLRRRARRKAAGSCFAAAASSSTKLSITKLLCVTPTPRQNPVFKTGSSWRTYSIRIAGMS